ncbi:ParB/RepB/Spo0J family partition protein [Streptomyces sp. SP17BM10]|uniref:ParB/RepB/Spo0J family partition protein n=1 Tax=Streptomyces sp. SP17BM10 TaxID=3002530 RepID=UPI002E779C42|nr:ParB/RepB/Spo0J family partition protein [Streptomyces sp. SP17BM10]MEE1782726.1 ParB/RepB/Spo0J family partition protein [Streptomyces sp. SP17BM10]
MSIAKKLAGGGGSFGSLAQGERRQDEVVARSEALDATGRVRRSSVAPVASVVFNPLNPRKTINDETIDELAESMSRGQIVPVTVVSRGAFLDAHPEQAGAIGDADFVALDGNRRLRAAQRAGLEVLRVDLNDDLAASASDLVEAALVANIHREDVAPFEEAQAIEQLVTDVYGGNQAAVARKLGKSAAWVGQRLALLHLTPELQEQASAGELAIEEARKIGAAARAGKLTASGQLERAEAAKKAAAHKQAVKAEAKAKRAAPARPGAASDARAEASPSPRAAGDVNAVYAAGAETATSDGGQERERDVNAVYAPAVPDQREARPEGGTGGGLGLPNWQDLNGVAGWICRFLTPDEARVVAQTVLSKVEEIEQSSARGH